MIVLSLVFIGYLLNFNPGMVLPLEKIKINKAS